LVEAAQRQVAGVNGALFAIIATRLEVFTTDAVLADVIGARV
jgi:hypothetical protein